MKELTLQVNYVKRKFEFLLNIKINNSYVTYLSIYQKPKIFATKNKEKSFFYDIKKDEFVDFDGNKYEEFPILPNSIIYLEEESKIVNKISSDLFFLKNLSVTLIKKEKNIDNFKLKTNEEIENNLNDNELYLYISSEKFNYYYKLNNSFDYVVSSGNNLFKEEYEKIYQIIIN